MHHDHHRSQLLINYLPLPPPLPYFLLKLPALRQLRGGVRPPLPLDGQLHRPTQLPRLLRLSLLQRGVRGPIFGACVRALWQVFLEASLEPPSPTSSSSSAATVATLALALWTLLAGVYLVALLGFHVTLLALTQTTYEYLQGTGPRSSRRRSFCDNCCRLWCRSVDSSVRLTVPSIILFVHT
jgi:hypothetical protein